MPLFDTKCNVCGVEAEQFLKMNEDTHPCTCGGHTRKLPSRIATERQFAGEESFSNRWEFHPDEVKEARATPGIAASGAKVHDDGRVSFDKRSTERKFHKAMQSLERDAYGSEKIVQPDRSRPKPKRKATAKFERIVSVPASTNTTGVPVVG